MKDDDIRKLHIEVNGIVQGVGFRPFLHRIARENGVTGWVRNTNSGVEGTVEGKPSTLGKFLKQIETDPPPMAVIDSVKAEDISSASDPENGGKRNTFTILESRVKKGYTLISPDTAMCSDCERELDDLSDRRYRFPFINCTNCGPRYTIIESLPYDRKRTTMRDFPMCTRCKAEYGDIENRRYHAQPDCCGNCGPEVFYFSTCEPDKKFTGDEAFLRTGSALKDGGIVAVKGIGGIHLACDALNESAVRRLREKKGRREKPLAVMAASVKDAEKICEISPEERKILLSGARPIVLLKKKCSASESKMDLLSFSGRIGVMLPYSPLHHLLFAGRENPRILVMTSGNISGCPVITENDEAFRNLKEAADGFLLHNRRIANRCDDSLVMEWQGKPYFFRRSRGYVPAPVNADIPDPDGITAFGAEQRASFAVGRDGHVLTSPYIGDLKNAETFSHYAETMEKYERLFNVTPSLFVCDLHPDYMSVREAQRQSEADGVSILRVQHHWAHMASCMADNNLSEKCFGIVWDGTGLGSDSSIWGGEFLLGDFSGFERVGTIRPVKLAGGDRAVNETGRITLAMALDAFGDDALNDKEISGLIPLSGDKKEMLTKLIKNAAEFAPAASSVGRLFDGVCSMITGRETMDYDGEGPALLEAFAPRETPPEDKDFDVLPENMFYTENGLRIFDTRPLIRRVFTEAAEGKEKGEIAEGFMDTLIRAALSQCVALNVEKYPVVLSGGVFLNRYLLSGMTRALENAGFRVYTHHRVSPSDEGICLGQIAVGAAAREALKSREI